MGTLLEFWMQGHELIGQISPGFIPGNPVQELLLIRKEIPILIREQETPILIVVIQPQIMQIQISLLMVHQQCRED